MATDMSWLCCVCVCVWWQVGFDSLISVLLEACGGCSQVGKHAMKLTNSTGKLCLSVEVSVFPSSCWRISLWTCILLSGCFPLDFTYIPTCVHYSAPRLPHHSLIHSTEERHRATNAGTFPVSETFEWNETCSDRTAFPNGWMRECMCSLSRQTCTDSYWVVSNHMVHVLTLQLSISWVIIAASVTTM